jgi:hypothetical protein
MVAAMRNARSHAWGTFGGAVVIPRALSVRHPWAFAITHLGKTYENRPRRFHYGGPLLVDSFPMRYFQYFSVPALMPSSAANCSALSPLSRQRSIRFCLTSSSFVLELGQDRRLQIPSRFDASALERLLSLLERR